MDARDHYDAIEMEAVGTAPNQFLEQQPVDRAWTYLAGTYNEEEV